MKHTEISGILEEEKRESEEENMEKKKIGIIFGGCSPEYDVSLESSYSVITHINQEKYEIVLIGITKEGDWFHYEGDVEAIKEEKWREAGICTPVTISSSRSDHGILEMKDGKAVLTKIDVFFPVLHGKNGEDGTVQGLIELSGVPMVGCGLLSSSLCMDKALSHRLVESYGIKVAKSVVITYESKNIQKLIEPLKFPVFVKPMRAGSSFGITKVERKEEIGQALEEAFQYDTEVIVEENVEGFEIGCAVLGNEELTVGEVDEIELSKGFFNFTEKYTLKTSKIHVPARIAPEVATKAKETAKQIYKILKCKDFARVDLFLTPDNEIYFNEINTIPGFTSHSRYPSMMKEIGMDFGKLVDTLINMEI